jgi:hypothetical protein
VSSRTERTPTLYEWAGGHDAIERLIDRGTPFSALTSARSLGGPLPSDGPSAAFAMSFAAPAGLNLQQPTH